MIGSPHRDRRGGSPIHATLEALSSSRGHIDRARLVAAQRWATERYRACDVCAELCGVDRFRGGLGVCGLGPEGRVYKEYLHMGEEACLLPSHTVFLTGCNFRCAFCSDERQVRSPQLHGRPMEPEELAARIAARRAQGARNVNFVGGLPDVNLLFILRTLVHCPPDTKVVWNTNLWTTREALDRLTGVVGVWLADYKFGNDRCALKLATIRRYTDRLRALFPYAAARGQLLVRHLLMPGHLDCCTRPVLRWLAEHLPDVPVNLMTAYHPFGLAGRRTPLGAGLTAAERETGVRLLAESGLRVPLLDGVEFNPST